MVVRGNRPADESSFLKLDPLLECDRLFCCISFFSFYSLTCSAFFANICLFLSIKFFEEVLTGDTSGLKLGAREALSREAVATSTQSTIPGGPGACLKFV